MHEERLAKLTILLLFTKNVTLRVSNTRVYGCGPNATLYIRNLHNHILSLASPYSNSGYLNISEIWDDFGKP